VDDRLEAERATARARQPAGLEVTGRDETLTRPPEIHPSGIRADSRSTVPGTEIPDGAGHESDEETSVSPPSPDR
jgi:hypothetical protein